MMLYCSIFLKCELEKTSECNFSDWRIQLEGYNAYFLEEL